MTRDEWQSCENAYTLMRAVGDAHVRGTVTSRRLVQVTLRCVEPVAYLLSDESLTALADLTAWSHGADEVDLSDVRRRLEREVAAAAAEAAAVLAVAWAAADAAAWAADATATTAAYVADAWAAYAAARAAALCDVIRDAVTYEEIQ
jgi:hypothetical protein